MTMSVCTGNNGSVYDQFHAPTIAGTKPLIESASAYSAAATDYDQHAVDLKAALAGIKVSYTGTAADQMQGAFDPMIKAMGDGHTAATAASKSLEDQAGHFTTAQSKIVQTQPVPDEPWYEHMVPWNTDHDDAIEANNKINEANNKAFSEYIDNTQSNKLPQFTDNNVYNAGNVSVTGGNQVHSGNPDQAVGGYNGPHGGGGSTSHTAGGGSGGGGTGGYNPGGGGTGGYNPGGGAGGIGQDGGGGWTPPGPGSSTGTQGAGGGAGGYPGGFTPGGYNPGDAAAAYGGGFGPVGGFGGAGGGSFGGGGGSAGGGKFGGGGAGIGGGAGGASGAGAKGAGAMSGAGAAAAEEAAGRGSAAGAKGAAGAPGAGGMAAGQRGGGKKEEDGEHKAADYLVNDDFASDITGDIPPALPAGGVIGF